MPGSRKPPGGLGQQSKINTRTHSHFPRFGGDMKSRISQILKTNTGLLYPKFHTHTHTQHKHARSDPLTTSPQHLHTDQLTHTSPMFTHTHTNTHTHTRTDPMTQMGPTFSHTTHLQHGLAGLWTCPMVDMSRYVNGCACRHALARVSMSGQSNSVAYSGAVPAGMHLHE